MTLTNNISNKLCVLQDGSQLAVAVKTCKVDNEESIAEKFLEEACK